MKSLEATLLSGVGERAFLSRYSLFLLVTLPVTLFSFLERLARHPCLLRFLRWSRSCNEEDEKRLDNFLKEMSYFLKEMSLELEEALSEDLETCSPWDLRILTFILTFGFVGLCVGAGIIIVLAIPFVIAPFVIVFTIVFTIGIPIALIGCAVATVVIVVSALIKASVLLGLLLPQSTYKKDSLPVFIHGISVSGYEVAVSLVDLYPHLDKHYSDPVLSTAGHTRIRTNLTNLGAALRRMIEEAHKGAREVFKSVVSLLTSEHTKDEIISPPILQKNIPCLPILRALFFPPFPMPLAKFQPLLFSLLIVLPILKIPILSSSIQQA